MILVFVEDIAGEEAAGTVQFAIKYHSSGAQDDSLSQSPMAPGYLKESTSNTSTTSGR